MKKTDRKAKDYMLVMHCLNGHQWAWDQLYNQSKRIVLGFARKYMLSFRVDALSFEDIVAEAYSRAFNKLNSFNGHALFSTWVCGFVKRIIWNENTKSCRRERIMQKNVRTFSIIYSNDPCDIILAFELKKSLWNAFEKLTPIESYILENHVVNIQSFSELSKSTHLSLRSVEVCYKNALRKYSKYFHIFHSKNIF